jgi:hypothetical protein
LPTIEDSMLDDNDRDALARAWKEYVAAQLHPTTHRLGTLEDQDFACYCVQIANLHLKPWQTPPCCLYGWEASEIKDWDKTCFQIMRKLVSSGLSIYEPDPMQALKGKKKSRR